MPPESPSVLLLGVDAGGSHTAVAIGDARGRVLARAEGPGSAMRPGGAERSAAVILDVARRAATQAKVSLPAGIALVGAAGAGDRKSTRLNSSHGYISYAVFCLKKKKKTTNTTRNDTP